MNADGSSKVCVLGAGTMGGRIAVASAVIGRYHVAIYDVSPDALAAAPARLREYGQSLIARNRASATEVESGLARITLTQDPAEAARDADLLSESAPEILAVKRQMHAEFDRLCPPHAVMTTNTSSLLVSAIEDVVARGDRFAALHFHGGLGNLVDIMRGPRTSDDTVSFLERFARRIGEVPMVMKKEKGGYLYNSLLLGLLGSALELAAGGYGDPHDIDRAYMLVSGTPYGPFAMMDGIGLNVIYDAWRNPAAGGNQELREQVVALLAPFIERGDLGAKTGRGFYSYPDPAFRKAGFLTGE